MNVSTSYSVIFFRLQLDILLFLKPKLLLNSKSNFICFHFSKFNYVSQFKIQTPDFPLKIILN